MTNLHNIEKRKCFYKSQYTYRGWNSTGNLFRIRKVKSLWYATGAPNDNHDLGSLYHAPTLTKLSALLASVTGR